MSEYPNTITECINVVVQGLTGVAARYFAEKHPILSPDTIHADQPGRKFTRIYSQHHDSNGHEGQRMVEFFVDNTTGDVFKGCWARPESKVSFYNIATSEGRARLFAAKAARFNGYMYADFASKF